MHITDIKIGDIIVLNNGADTTRTYLVLEALEWTLTILSLNDKHKGAMIQSHDQESLFDSRFDSFNIDVIRDGETIFCQSATK